MFEGVRAGVSRVGRGPLRALLAACSLLLLVPSASAASTIVFGSPLAAPATLNTAENLSYLGTYTLVPPSPEFPTGVFHNHHWAADTALWNERVAGGQASSPATGQAVKVRVEGCARGARGAAPLRQIHLQDLSPVPGGGTQVNLTSQPFDLPRCGDHGANGSTVTTYEPINLCVAAGDYVALNDEGGFVPYVYPSGVPYQVIGAREGSTLDSFVRNNGTGNGAILSAHDTTAADGFASNADQELMMQVVLGTGPDATHICPGGTAGAPRVYPAVHLRPQTDGVNHSQIVSVALYCHPANGCGGLATLGTSGRAASFGHTNFSMAGETTAHVPIHISSRLMSLIRRHHGASVVLTVTMGAKTFTQAITIKIF